MFPTGGIPLTRFIKQVGSPRVAVGVWKESMISCSVTVHVVCHERTTSSRDPQVNPYVTLWKVTLMVVTYRVESRIVA